MRGRPMPLGLRLAYWFADQVLFKPLRDQLGFLRLRRAYTGGAALGPDVFRFFHAIGVNLKQVYGQTEIIGIAFVHRDGDVRHDTVGLPIPGTEVRISEAGEILLRSDAVCAGYWERPEATQETFGDGWLHTGDAGYLTEDGHLVVIDRLSDVMRTEKGTVFSPQFLENKLKFSPYIKEAVVFGDRKPYLAAFINIDPQTVGKWAEDRGLAYTTYLDLSLKPEVAELIRKEVEKVNKELPEELRIQRFVLLYKLLDADDEELTRTGKVRRGHIAKKYAPWWRPSTPGPRRWRWRPSTVTRTAPSSASGRGCPSWGSPRRCPRELLPPAPLLGGGPGARLRPRRLGLRPHLQGEPGGELRPGAVHRHRGLFGLLGHGRLGGALSFGRGLGPGLNRPLGLWGGAGLPEAHGGAAHHLRHHGHHRPRLPP